MVLGISGRVFATAILILAAPAWGQDTDTDDVEAEGDPTPAAVDDADDVETIVVTGSRLPKGDPTAFVYSLTVDDFEARGVSSVEELMRTLPWAYHSINQQTSAIDSSALAPSDVDKNPRFVDNGSTGLILFEVITGFGTSTANLRALGSANTLVLINGRRIAGRAGDEEGYVNLLNVPLSAIERVDVQLDGGSAVYGADAIGGVINFITKKNYTGFGVKVRQDISSTGADRMNASVQGGYGWGKGQITGTLQRTSQDPIVNAKTGWTTNDNRSLFGPEFDDRDTTKGQPGVARRVCQFSWGSYPCGDRLQLPAGHSGEGASPDDFTTDIIPVDYVPPQNGEDATNTSLTVFVEQFVTEDLRVFVDALYSEHEAYQEYRTDLSGYTVPASNAYNPFGQDVVVNYLPAAEVEAGLLPGAYHESKNEQRTINAGFTWDFADDHQLELYTGSSESENFGWQVAYLRPNWMADGDPAKARVLEVLASSDPAVAINLFGDGSSQSSNLGELASPWIGPHRGATETNTYDLLARGQLFELPGGSIGYAVGTHRREERIRLIQQDYSDQPGRTETKGLEVLFGVDKPKRDLAAYSVEFAIPIFGEGNARPGLHSLMLNVQARRDRYEATGAVGGVHAGPREWPMGACRRAQYRHPDAHPHQSPDRFALRAGGEPGVSSVLGGVVSPARVQRHVSHRRAPGGHRLCAGSLRRSGRSSLPRLRVSGPQSDDLRGRGRPAPGNRGYLLAEFRLEPRRPAGFALDRALVECRFHGQDRVFLQPALLRSGSCVHASVDHRARRGRQRHQGIRPLHQPVRKGQRNTHDRTRVQLRQQLRRVQAAAQLYARARGALHHHPGSGTGKPRGHRVGQQRIRVGGVGGVDGWQIRRGSIRPLYAELRERPDRYVPGGGWPLRTPLLRPAVDDGRLLHHC